jgi:hypothetical protein
MGRARGGFRPLLQVAQFRSFEEVTVKVDLTPAAD